jgi:hypothetical protein
MSVLLIRLYVISGSITDVFLLRPIQIQKGSNQDTMKFMVVREVLLERATRQDHEVELQYRPRISGFVADYGSDWLRVQSD